MIQPRLFAASPLCLLQQSTIGSISVVPRLYVVVCRLYTSVVYQLYQGICPIERTVRHFSFFYRKPGNKYLDCTMVVLAFSFASRFLKAWIRRSHEERWMSFIVQMLAVILEMHLFRYTYKKFVVIHKHLHEISVIKDTSLIVRKKPANTGYLI